MARRQRASWGSNEDAGRGRRRIRYWADLHDGRGYRRVSETVRGTRKDADDVLARLLADMDDGSQEMRELRAEVVRDMLDDARARRREREESSAASVLSVASLYPFLTFFACWLVVYIAVGGTFEDGRLPLAVLLCAACTLLDVAAHLLSVLHSARRRR